MLQLGGYGIAFLGVLSYNNIKSSAALPPPATKAFDTEASKVNTQEEEQKLLAETYKDEGKA